MGKTCRQKAWAGQAWRPQKGGVTVDCGECPWPVPAALWKAEGYLRIPGACHKCWEEKHMECSLWCCEGRTFIQQLQAHPHDSSAETPSLCLGLYQFIWPDLQELLPSPFSFAQTPNMHKPSKQKTGSTISSQQWWLPSVERTLRARWQWQKSITTFLSLCVRHLGA